MKKTGVFLSFLIIVIFFLGLNFLLWDREAKERDLKGLQESSAGSALTISAMNRQIESLENSLKTRNETLERLSGDNDDLKSSLDDMRNINNSALNILTDKSTVINDLYLKLDGAGYFTTIIEKWAQYINEGDYKSAYEMWYSKSSAGPDDIDEFTNRFVNIISSIDVVSVELHEFKPPDIIDIENAEVRLKELSNGDLFLLVDIDAQIEDWAEKYDIYFEKGLNKRIFVLKFDGEWLISDIRDLK